MIDYQEIFDNGPYVHYLVISNNVLVGVFDNAIDTSQIILNETNTDNIQIKELHVNKYWKNYAKNIKHYQTINKYQLMCIISQFKYINDTSRSLGIYELIFLKFMLNPEMLVRNEKLVNITKIRLNEYFKKYNKGSLRYSKVMFEFKKFLKFALRRYDSYSYRPYNLRNKK